VAAQAAPCSFKIVFQHTFPVLIRKGHAVSQIVACRGRIYFSKYPSPLPPNPYLRPEWKDPVIPNKVMDEYVYSKKEGD
jgi:hypothetical protein